MRVVLDANIVVSFLLTRGETISSIFKFWDEGAFKVLVSNEILKEFESVLNYKKIDRLLDSWEKKALLEKLQLQGELVSVESNLDIVRDPDDNKYVECAVDGKADYIVSGDKDLLVLESYDDITIVNAREFVKLLQS